MITTNSTICRKKEIVTAEMDNQIVMMSMENGFYYGLDDIATDIWSAIEQSVTVSDLVTKLAEEYSVARDICQKDVLEFLTKMDELNLIEVRS